MIEKILERLEAKKKEYLEAFKTHGDNERYGIACGFGDSIKIVQEVAKDGGWIPCSERLPKNTDNVLITTRYGVVLMVFLGMSKNWCYLNGKRITDSQDMPIAWQPLPAPFKKGE